jgi:hypothetical protein
MTPKKTCHSGRPCGRHVPTKQPGDSPGHHLKSQNNSLVFPLQFQAAREYTTVYAGFARKIKIRPVRIGCLQE